MHIIVEMVTDCYSGSFSLTAKAAFLKQQTKKKRVLFSLIIFKREKKEALFGNEHL